MRYILALILLSIVLTGCERIPVYAVRVADSDLEARTEYRPEQEERRYWDRHWTYEDDSHRLLVKLKAYPPDSIGVYARTVEHPPSNPGEPGSAQAGAWWGPGGKSLLLTATTECPTTTQYFEQAGNSMLYNFDKPGYPDIYPYAPETSPPDVAAILTVTQCKEVDPVIRIEVLGDDGAVEREHRMTLRREEIDWYYNIPLFE